MFGGWKSRIFAAFLVALMLIGVLESAKASVIFSDDFEAAQLDSRWTKSAQTSIPRLVTNQAAHGSQSAQFNISMPLFGTIETTFSPPKAFTFECYFLTDTLPTSADPSLLYSYLTFAAVLTDKVKAPVMLSLYRDNEGNVAWAFQDSEGDYRKISSDVQANTWYKFDVAVKVSFTAFSYDVSINDRSRYIGTSVNDGGVPTTLIIGNFLMSGSGLNKDGLFYLDSVKMEDSVVDWERNTSPTASPMAVEPTISPTPTSAQTFASSATAEPVQPDQNSANTPAVDTITLVVVAVAVTAIVVFVVTFSITRKFNASSIDC